MVDELSRASVRNWSPIEEVALGMAVKRYQQFAYMRLQRNATASDQDMVSTSDSPPSYLLWAEVSKAFAGLRTPHECATHWHKLKEKIKPGLGGT